MKAYFLYSGSPIQLTPYGIHLSIKRFQFHFKMLHSQKSIEKILSDIERDVKQDLDYNTKRSSIWELHQSAPESLKQRLVKILPLELFLGDESFEEDATKMKTIEPDLQAEIEKRMPTLDNILEERDIDVDSAFELMSRAYQEVRLRSEESGSESHQRFREKKVNWIAEYVKKLRRHRVQWDSKLYRDAAKNWHKKSMIENGNEKQDDPWAFLNLFFPLQLRR